MKTLIVKFKIPEGNWPWDWKNYEILEMKEEEE